MRDDFEWLHRINSDPEVKRYVGGPATREGTGTMMRERIFAYYDANPGLGMWVTEERATGAPIGFHLLMNIQGETDIQVGYVLDQPFWGMGYATEMCRALLHYGFTQVRLPRIVAITDLPNVASQKVLLKCGLRRNGERTFSHPAYRGAPLAWFERDAAQWLAEIFLNPDVADASNH